MDYSKGRLATPTEHLAEGGVGEYLFGLDIKKKYYVRVSEEEEYKTLQQIRLIHSLFRLLHLSSCMDDRLDDEDKIKDYFKQKLGLVKTWGYVNDENRLKLVKERREVPENALAIPYKLKSFSNISKKALKEVIEYVLNYCDKHNMVGNLNSQEKKYIEIRNELDNRR